MGLLGPRIARLALQSGVKSMNLRRAKANWYAAIAAIAFLVCAPAADAGLLFLSGDSNIVSSLTGATPDAGNQQFFLNVLGAGTSVLVLETSVTPVFSTPVNDFYNSQAGVSSTLFSGAVTGALLSGVDLFFSPLPEDSFTASELDALGDYLEGGGTIFFAGDNPGFAPDPNARINDALTALGSGMLILDVALDIGDQHALPSQILLDPFTTGVTTFNYGGMSEISGGTTLFVSLEESPFVAYEQTNGETPVPEPGTLLLLGAGLVALSRRRRN
jgi:hypothetical protein